MNKSVGGQYQTDAPVFDAHARAGRERREALERDRLSREREAATTRSANSGAAIVAALVAVIGALVMTTCSPSEDDKQVERAETRY